MKVNRIAVVLLTAVCCLTAAGCANDTALQDGFYTAQAAEFSHGWKEYVAITVQSGKIISIEYNAANESGFIKSWDNAYMSNMKAVTGTYPNEYTRNYAAQILQNQAAGVDAITGATTSAQSFDKLSAAVIEQARRGDSQIVIVAAE